MSLFRPSDPLPLPLKLNLKDKAVFLNYLTDESLCGKVMFDYEAKETTTSTTEESGEEEDAMTRLENCIEEIRAWMACNFFFEAE